MSIETVDKSVSYEEERGKPMPSFNHGAIQANLVAEFAQQRSFRVLSELTLDINGKSYTPDLSIYPRTPLDLRRDTPHRTDPPLLAVEVLSPRQGTQDVLDKMDVYFA